MSELTFQSCLGVTRLGCLMSVMVVFPDPSFFAAVITIEPILRQKNITGKELEGDGYAAKGTG